jgi:hypothetical protein
LNRVGVAVPLALLLAAEALIYLQRARVR